MFSKELLDRYFPAGEVHTLAGRSGAGKTHLAFQFLSEMIKEKTLTNDEILYFTADRRRRSYDAIFKKLEIEPWKLLSKIDLDAKDFNLKTTRERNANPITCLKWAQEEIIAHYRETKVKPRLVIFDPGQRFIACSNLNDQGLVSASLGNIASWVTSLNIALILVWHNNKQLAKNVGDVFDRISGSSALQGYTSTKIVLCAQAQDPNSPGDHVDAPCFFIRGQEFADMKGKLHRDQKGLFVLDKISTFDPQFGEFTLHESAFDNLIWEHQVLYNLIPQDDPGITVKELITQTNRPSTSLYRDLKALEEKGLVESPAKGFFRQTLKM